MAHFVRRKADADWIGYTFAADGSDFSNSTNGLDVKQTKAINGDDGGTWAPSAQIIIGGTGLRVTGPCLVSNAGTIETQSGTKFTLGDNDYPVLKTGHSGAARVLLQSTMLATSLNAMVAANGAGLQTTALGQLLVIPMVKLHNAATLVQVLLNFEVGLAHAGVPAILPAVRVFRQNASGVVDSLKTGGGADVFGWVSLPTPVSGAAWYNGGAAQTFVYTCNQNNVLDTSTYSYGVMITDENGANSHINNIWLGMQATCGSIADLRFQ